MNDHSFLAFFFFFAAFSSGLFFISLPRDAAVYPQKQPPTFETDSYSGGSFPVFFFKGIIRRKMG